VASLEDGLGDAKVFVEADDGYKERKSMGEGSRVDRNVENHGDAKGESKRDACGTEDGKRDEEGRIDKDAGASEKADEGDKHEDTARHNEQDVDRREGARFESRHRQDNLKINRAWRDGDPFSKSVDEIQWFRDRVDDLYVDD